MSQVHTETSDQKMVIICFQKSTSELKVALDQQQNMSDKVKELEKICAKLKEEAKDAAEQTERREEENVLLRSTVTNLSREITDVREDWEEDRRQHQLSQEDQERRFRRLEQDLELLKEKERQLEEEKLKQQRLLIQLEEMEKEMREERERQRRLEEEASDLNQKLKDSQLHVSSLKQDARRRDAAEQEVKGLKLQLECQVSE